MRQPNPQYTMRISTRCRNTQSALAVPKCASTTLVARYRNTATSSHAASTLPVLHNTCSTLQAQPSTLQVRSQHSTRHSPGTAKYTASTLQVRSTLQVQPSTLPALHKHTRSTLQAQPSTLHCKCAPSTPQLHYRCSQVHCQYTASALPALHKCPPSIIQVQPSTLPAHCKCTPSTPQVHSQHTCSTVQVQPSTLPLHCKCTPSRRSYVHCQYYKRTPSTCTLGRKRSQGHFKTLLVPGAFVYLRVLSCIRLRSAAFCVY